MKQLKVLSISMLIFLSSFQVHASKIQWAKFLKDTTRLLVPNSYEIQGKCLDNSNNIYYCYAKFGTDTTISFITKLSPDGQVLWEKSLFPIQYNNQIICGIDNEFQMHVDQNNNLIIAGALWDTLGYALNNSFTRKLFFKKWNLNGLQLSEKIAPLVSPNDHSNAYLSDFKTKPNGDIFLCNYFIDSMSFLCQIYGVNSNFDSIFSAQLNMVSDSNFTANRAPKMALNDTSITLTYSFFRNDFSGYLNYYLLQFSLATADTNWIKTRVEYSGLFSKQQIEISNSGIYMAGNGIEKYSLAGDSVAFNRSQAINHFILDESSGKIFAHNVYVENEMQITQFDTNLNIMQIIYPIYNFGLTNRLINVVKKDTTLITYGFTTDPNDNNKLVSIDINKLDLNGNLLNTGKINLSPMVYGLFSTDAPLIDLNQDIITIASLQLEPLLDTANNQLEALPIFGCKFSFDTTYNISGTVFIDENPNCQIDGNEIGLENNLIHLLPEDIYTFTDSTGFYSFKKSNGPATIEYIPFINGMNNCVASGTYSTNIANSTIIDSLDFGLQTATINYDARCELFVGASRPGYIQMANITIQNISSTTIHHIQTVLTFDSMYTFQGASLIPDSIIGYKAYWTFDSLLIGKIKNIYLSLTPLSTQMIGNQYMYTLQISADGDTINTTNNLDTVRGIVSGSYDPNHKIATPTGMGTEGFIENNATLNYYIEFQNTGTDTAFTVKLTDELDQNLDLSTLTIQGSSHSMYYTLNNRMLTFYFNNILLPDSNKDYQKSIGYVAYSIKPKPNSLGSKIRNNANIYFDFNEPIITNTTINTIGVPTNILNIEMDDIIAYPIPLFENQLSIDVNIASASSTKLELNDISGRKLHTILNGYKEKGTYQFKLDNSIFNSKQLYFLTLTTQNSKKSIKILKH